MVKVLEIVDMAVENPSEENLERLKRIMENYPECPVCGSKEVLSETVKNSRKLFKFFVTDGLPIYRTALKSFLGNKGVMWKGLFQSLHREFPKLG